MKLSKTRIDHLGDQLRKGTIGDSDLRTLDDYRRSFGQVYETVVQTIREKLQLEPTGRPAKSTSSIIEKLHRESIRLSQMQDIAGGRIVVENIAAQEHAITLISRAFDDISIVDRRVNPSHGYRAVHVIVRILDKLIEIQIRTVLQHLWAEFSEKLSDHDPGIKYGAGNRDIQYRLINLSRIISKFENIELKVTDLLTKSTTDEKIKLKLESFQQEMDVDKESIIKSLKDIISFDSKKEIP